MLTRTGGDGTVVSSAIYKIGKIAHLTFTIKIPKAINMATNLFAGTISSGNRPVNQINFCAYMSSTVFAGYIDSNGNMIIRVAGQNLSITGTATFGVSYILA